MKKIIQAATMLILCALTGAGCRHEANIPVTKVDSGRFYLHLHTNIGTNEVDEYGDVYTTPSGRKMSLTIAQLYLSHISLVRNDGYIYEIPGTIVLTDPETEQYFIGNVPAGTYKSIQFHAGLDANTASELPSANSALNHPEMWFSTNPQTTGYVFLNLQGSIDTTAAANSTIAQMQPFIFKIGTSSHYTLVTMPDHSPAYTISANGATEGHITIDYAQLFNGIQLSNGANLSINTVADNGSAAGNAAGNNIPSMFSYEE